MIDVHVMKVGAWGQLPVYICYPGVQLLFLCTASCYVPQCTATISVVAITVYSCCTPVYSYYLGGCYHGVQLLYPSVQLLSRWLLSRCTAAILVYSYYLGIWLLSWCTAAIFLPPPTSSSHHHHPNTHTAC